MLVTGGSAASEPYDCACQPTCAASVTPLDERTLHVRRPGVQALEPIGPPLPSTPEFSLPALFPSLGGTIPAGFELASMSLGQDILPTDATGNLIVGPGPFWWAALLFSVRHDTAMDPMLAPAIALETLRPDGPGGDVFSYVFPGSNLPRDLVAVVERAVDAPESGLFFPGAGGRPPSTGRIAGLDFVLPHYRLPGLVPLLLPRPTFYFTLTRATVFASPAVVPASWWAGETPSSATILETTWDGATWSLPRPSASFTHRDLRLAVDDEIDGLSVDLDGCRILFSTHLPPGPPPAISQLRFANRCAPGHLAVYVGDFLGPSAVPMTTVIGLSRTTDVTSLCDIDPTTPVPNSAHQFVIARTPSSPVQAFPRTLDAQTYRGNDPASPTRATVESFVTGWPPGGRAPGFLVLTIADLATGFGAYVLAVAPRCTLGPDVGDPTLFRFPLPQNMPYFAPVPLQWFALSLSNGAIGASHPMVMFL